MEGSGSEQWGENWVEDFGSGAGNKKGETWSVDGGGHRYQRWWGEEHFGNSWVRRFGNSTTGAASHILLPVSVVLQIPDVGNVISLSLSLHEIGQFATEAHCGRMTIARCFPAETVTLII